MRIENLPNDINQLKKLLIEKDKEIQELKDIITVLQRKKFAPSSETRKDKQVFNETEEIDSKIDENEEKKTITYERKKRGKRKPISESLPRVDEIIDLDEDEKIGMKLIGEQISEKLIIEPAKVYVQRIIRKKYAPISNEGSIKIKPLPPQLLPKTISSPSLIAYIITAKYVDALPLYRQENIFKRVCADITRQTMARWLIQVAGKLLPLYNLLQDMLLESDYLQMDESPTQVLNEKGKKATSKSYMWIRHAPGENPIVLYDYAPNRSGEIPLELLEGYSGSLQVDGYDGYSKACEKYQLTRLGCMDHCRRKFFTASKTSGGKNIGRKGINILDQLYEIEEKIRGDSPEARHQYRQEKSLPILAKFKSWVDEIRPKITPKSVAGKAIHYTYNEWKYLVRYTDSPKYNISNIWIENAIRPFSLGKKNWLFSASVDGAKSSALFYSLIETAKKNNLEPFDYLSKMLERLPSAETVEDFEKLLPLKSKFQI